MECLAVAEVALLRGAVRVLLIFFRVSVIFIVGFRFEAY